MDENDYCNEKIDNWLKKKELEEKNGAKFSQCSNIQAELEHEWLTYIERFEKEYNKQETKTVWEYIGKPLYRKVDALKPEEIIFELQRMLNIMNKNNIELTTLCYVEHKELYRFITEELFVEKLDIAPIEGMTTNYIYEEFYPNAKYDIEQAYLYFLTVTLAKTKKIDESGYGLLYVNTEDYQNKDGKRVDQKIVITKINNFLDSFDYFKVVSNKIKQIAINEENTDSQLTFEIHFEGHFNDCSESFPFKGNGMLKLAPSEYGGWEIYHISMPGLAI